jgi:hypothetical protein
MALPVPLRRVMRGHVDRGSRASRGLALKRQSTQEVHHANSQNRRMTGASSCVSA